MKASEILREAAESVHSGRETFGCNAVAVVKAASADKDRAERYIWELYFGWHKGAPEHDAVGGVKPWRVFFWGVTPRCEERVIGLCLAAAVAESEGQ